MEESIYAICDGMVNGVTAFHPMTAVGPAQSSAELAEHPRE
jgi:hypothetical protein